LSGYFCQSGTCHLDAVAVGMGGNFGTAVLSDGSVYAWGYNAQGSVGPNGPPGDGSGTGEPIQNSPVKVTGLGAAKSLAAGGVHVCALLANGEVWCWGSNASGQLGNGTVTTNYNPTPSKVTGLPSGVTAISGGDYATCALVGASGDVYCWGNNYYGIFGTNTTATTVSTPVKIAGLGKVTQLSVSSHACVVVGSTEYCWGNNSNSECGQPSSTYAISTPVAIGFGMLGAPQLVSATGGHSCSLLSGGGVYCWGWNVYGDLGDPNSTVGANVQNPVPVATLTGVSKLATDSYSNCAVLTNGKVRCWGVQRFGALGDGHTDTDGYVVTPVEVGGVSSATAISMNQGHTLVLLANGAIKSWGEGAVGELGNSMSSHSATAVDVTATW
jgi:alpha-tubulin suppressor-like RCC1 family protein